MSVMNHPDLTPLALSAIYVGHWNVLLFVSTGWETVYKSPRKENQDKEKPLLTLNTFII